MLTNFRELPLCEVAGKFPARFRLGPGRGEASIRAILRAAGRYKPCNPMMRDEKSSKLGKH